jgi:hypothetical protein
MIRRFAPLAVVCIVAVAGAQPDWLIDPAPYEASVAEGSGRSFLRLGNGLVQRTFWIGPNLATVSLDQLATGESLLRAVKPEARVTIDGHAYDIGGLTGQPNHAYLDPEWIDGLTADPDAFRYTGHSTDRLSSGHPMWRRIRHAAPNTPWPPPGVALDLQFAAPPESPAAGVTATVHYDLYAGLPLFCKWLTITNGTDHPVTIDAITTELLAAVEAGSFVGAAPGQMPTPNIHIETDYSFGGGMSAPGANAHTVRWTADPEYLTQVNYERLTPCLLEVGPARGPAQTLAPGETFESFRTWELFHDSTDRERRGLAVRRMYRTIAPWVTENPLMMHVRYADWDTVKNAIDQCAEVGFEMVILTFGSGFDIENGSPEYLAEMKRYADYALSKGIEIGGYSLLSSRSIDTDNNVVSPEGEHPMFGNAPCIGSPWGQAYFDKLYAFYAYTGFMLLEHDGSYPGDWCASEDHPGHAGLADSQWNQWRTISNFYRVCRATGVYLNVPDWYYLAGSNKCGMGYRETNWSLPRAQQVIHTRQNIFDGTWEKTPSMGWMFVPLTEYHGGGEAATIEPLAEHLDHYERMLASNLALGVQACYRGPRLYDTDETRDMVKGWVGWYKARRDILESDLIHGRRADGRGVDWMLHVNPALETCGMLVAFNATEHEVTTTLRPDLYYTGLTDGARATLADGTTLGLTLARDYTVGLELTIPAGGMTWVEFREP